jgi:hypothetical protein
MGAALNFSRLLASGNAGGGLVFFQRMSSAAVVALLFDSGGGGCVFAVGSFGFTAPVGCRLMRDYLFGTN